jgi:hypothetical protein
VHRHAKREPREDRHLRGGVRAADVVGGIGLREAQPLRLGERLLVIAAAARHLREDEVRRAVDDAVDALDVRGGERFAQHAHDRDHACNGRLESQQHAALACQRPQLLAVAGEQLLVGGDHVLARAERAKHILASRFDPADQLDDQIRAVEDLREAALGGGESAAQHG